MKLTLPHLKALTRIPFVRGVATFQIGTVFMMLTGFLSSVLYARLLGLHDFGLYAVITAFVSFISIVCAYGQESTTTTFLAEAMGRKDKSSIEKVLRYYAQTTVVALVVYALLFFLAPILSQKLQGDMHIGTLARILILNSALQWPNVLAFMTLQLERKIALVTILENTSDILQVTLSTILLLQGFGVFGILIGTTTISLISVPVCLWLYNRSAAAQGLPSVACIIGNMFKTGTGTYIRQGFWIAIDQAIGKNLYPNLFTMILSATTTVETVGIFRLAFKLGNLPLSLIMPSITRMTAVSIPRIAASDPNNLFRSCKNVLIITIGLSVCACIGAALIVPPLVPIFYGLSFTDAIPIFLLLLPMNVIASMHVVSLPILRVIKRVWVISLTNCIGIVLSLGIYLAALRLFSASYSIAIAVLVFHVNTLLLFLYLFAYFSKKWRKTSHAS